MLNLPWQFRLFGEICATRPGDVIERFQNRKTGGLAALLAYNAGNKVSRDKIVDLLWPEQTVDGGRLCLRVALNSLRKRLEPPGVQPLSVIHASRSGLYFHKESVRTDAALFLDIASSAEEEGIQNPAEALRRVLEIYQGPLLPGIHSDWVGVERDRLEDRFTQLVGNCIDRLHLTGNAEEALTGCLEAVARADDSELLHVRALRLYRALGMHQHAARHFTELRERRAEVWGQAPPESIYHVVSDLGVMRESNKRSRGAGRGKRASRASDRATNSKLARTPLAVVRQVVVEKPPAVSRIPAPLHKLCGREKELDLICDLLMPHEGVSARLVTLTGAAGCGKTHLAAAAAHRLAPRFNIRAAFVQTSSLETRSQVALAILEAIGAPQKPPEDAVSSICEHVGDIPYLLVLDNMEHLIDECQGLVSELMESGASLSLLVTSRAPFSIPGEHTVVVLPLPVPVLKASPELLMEFACVEMFVDRAQEVRPDFHVTRGNSATVREICVALEGIPLAIELAAARLAALTPKQVAVELKNRFRFLVSRVKRSNYRHDTLEQAIGWSYMLLEPEARQFFCMMSVFRGSWSLEAARCVWSDRAKNQDDADAVLNHLETLVKRSLVIAEPVGEDDDMRYRLLESLREYGANRLSDRDREKGVNRLAHYMLDLAVSRSSELQGPKSTDAVKLLSMEVQNLRTAWSILKQVPPDALRFAASTWRFWYGQGLSAEGYDICMEALRSVPESDAEWGSEIHIGLILGAAVLAYRLGRFDLAEQHAQEGYGLAEERGDHRLIADALNIRGFLAGDRGDRERARAFLEKCVASRRRQNDMWSLGAALNNLARVLQADGEVQTARDRFAEAYQLMLASGDVSSAATAIMNVGVAADALGDYSGARFAYERSLELSLQCGVQRDLGTILYNLGEAMFRECGHPDASLHLVESLRIHMERGDLASMAYPLASLGNVAATGSPERAVRLHAAACSLRLTHGTPISPDGLATFHEDIERIRERMRPEDFDLAWRLGEAMDAAEAVIYAQCEPIIALEATDEVVHASVYSV